MRAAGRDGEEDFAFSVVSGSPHCIHILFGGMDISVQITS